MNNFFSTVRGRAMLLLPFLLVLVQQLSAQSTCDFTVAPETACVGGMSEYHISVQSSVNYYIIWEVGPAGVNISSNDEMLVVHWNTSGIAQITARIISVGSNTFLGACSVTTEVLANPSPEIVPVYLPEADCGRNLLAKAELLAGFCGDSEVQFYPSGAGGEFTWEVKSGGIPVSVVDDVLTVQLDGSGELEVCLTETNAAGCAKQICNKYYIFPPPVSSFTELTHGTSNPIDICRDETLVFMGKYQDPNDLEFGNWFWKVIHSGLVVGVGHEQNFEFTFEQPGTYVVSLYATNCLGCGSEPTQVIVNVNEASIPEIVCPSVVCQSAIPVEYCTTVDCSTFTWTQSGGTIVGPSNESCVDIVWDMPQENGYGIVWLEVDNCQSNQCPFPVAVEVPVIPAIQTITGRENLCNASTEGEIYSVPFWPGAVYEWSIEITNNITGGTVTGIPSGNEYTVNLNNFRGEFCVKVNITHPIANCVSNGELCVSVQNFSLAGGNFCFGSDVSLTINPPPNSSSYEVNWTVLQTGASQTENNTNMVTIPFSSFGGAGSFAVKAAIVFNGTTMFECDELIANVVIREPVEIQNITGPIQVCPNKPYKYVAIPSTGTFLWTVVGGTPASATGNNVNITWTAGASPRSITVVRTVNGCSSAPFVLNIVDIETLVPVIQGPQEFCEDDPETKVYTTNILDAEEYTWSVIPAASGSIVSGQGTPEIGVKWHRFINANTRIRLKVKVCGVEKTVDLPITLNLASIQIKCPTNGMFDDCRVCQGSAAVYTVNNNTGTKYVWYVDGELEATQFTPPFQLIKSFDEPGTHIIRVVMSGSPDCPGTFEDALPIEVVANPPATLSASDFPDCVNFTPLTLSASTYSSALSEKFYWFKDGSPAIPPVYEPIPTATSPQLLINATTVQELEGYYFVSIERVIDEYLTCFSYADLPLTCDNSIPDIFPHPDVIFTDWDFNLGIPNTECPPASANECGHVFVYGKLENHDFDLDVEAAAWRVIDYQNGLTNDQYPILSLSDLEKTEISTFQKVGYYPTYLLVKFNGDPNTYYDKRMLEIPLVPRLQWAYECGSTPGTYDLYLKDISDLLPGAVIHDRQWAISISTVNNGAPDVFNDISPFIIKTVPAGSVVTISLTPYTHTVGPDKPGMLYYCTECIQITLPEIPTLAIDATPGNDVCVGNTINFTATILPNADDIIKYDWNFGDGSGSSLLNPEKTYFSSGTFDATFTITTDFGCEIKATEPITVMSNMSNGAIQVMNDQCGYPSMLKYEPLTGSSTPAAFLWSPLGETMQMISTSPGYYVYDVTVTDEFGCTSSPAAVTLDLPDLFLGGIQGDLIGCEGEKLTFNVTGTPGFSYTWTSDIPGLVGNNTTASVSNVPYQSVPYSITVTATNIATGQTCTAVTTSVIVHPTPPAPTFDVDYSCDPFIAHIATDPSVSVAWAFQFHALGFGPDIWVNEGGTYVATVTSRYGCTATGSVNVDHPISMNVISGCYPICDADLEAGDICLEGPVGSFTYWEWALLPNTILDSGTGQVDDLCLTPAMEGEIVLRVQRNYQNSNPPPGSTLICRDESDPFCLEVIECNNCPEENISGYYVVECMMDGNEQVFSLHSALTIPDGWHYCGIEPEIDGGFILYNEGLPDFNEYTHELQIDGFLHVTNVAGYQANQGLFGSLIICNDLTEEQCTVRFFIPYQRCYEWVWCMMDVQETINNQELPPQYWTVTLTYSFPGHYTTLPCSVTQYVAYLGISNGANNLSQILAGPILYPATPPAFQMNSISVTIPYWKYQQGGCIALRYLSNCGHLCQMDYCYGEGGWGGIGGDVATSSDSPYLAINPNPASETVQVAYALKSGGSIQLRNGLGQVVRDIALNEMESVLDIDVSDLPPGVYLVSLRQNDTLVETKKLVITR